MGIPELLASRYRNPQLQNYKLRILKDVTSTKTRQLQQLHLAEAVPHLLPQHQGHELQEALAQAVLDQAGKTICRCQEELFKLKAKTPQHLLGRLQN